ncbi:MAG: hypothetical protein IJC87_04495 [Clostridia bacterium]|nr:hypothetical protein [Clostridia bacterium]
MKEYKVVPCQGKIVAESEAVVNTQIGALAGVIAQELVGGWELVTAMPIVVATTKKRFKGKELPYNALVFARELIKDEDDI